MRYDVLAVLEVESDSRCCSIYLFTAFMIYDIAVLNNIVKYRYHNFGGVRTLNFSSLPRYVDRYFHHRPSLFLATAHAAYHVTYI